MLSPFGFVVGLVAARAAGVQSPGGQVRSGVFGALLPTPVGAALTATLARQQAAAEDASGTGSTTPTLPPAGSVLLPNVVGKTLEDAKKLLPPSLFTVTVQDLPDPDPAGADRVIRQFPASGTVPTGQAVTLLVGRRVKPPQDDGPRLDRIEGDLRAQSGRLDELQTQMRSAVEGIQKQLDAISTKLGVTDPPPRR